METDKTGRPTFSIVVDAPDGRRAEFTGNIWEVLMQEANATFMGYTTKTADKQKGNYPLTTFKDKI
jgi:hypothetical protein